VIAAICTLLVASACGGGDSGDSGSGDSGEGSKASVAAPQGDPIRIGYICACSGSQSASLGHTKQVAEAWEKSVNASGGLNGVPVKVFYKDDGLDPAKSLQLVKELVEEDKVVAIVGNATVVDTSWADYVKEKGIPVVGGMTINGPVASNPDFFGTGPSLAMTIFFATKLATEEGAKKIGVGVCAESPLCAKLEQLVSPMASAYGAQTQGVKIDASAPNYTAQCLAWKKDKVDTLMILTDANVARRVYEDCAKQSYEPRIASPASSASNTWLDSPVFDGVVMPASEVLYTDTAVPGVQKYHDVLDEYAPKVMDAETFAYTDLEVWTGYQLFQKAAEAGGFTAATTPAEVTAALYALKDETLEGLTAPLTFTKDQPTFIPCAFMIKVEDSKLVSENGTTPSCLTSEEIGVFTKAVGA
jgi:branched-chain amino acid transport system substrate-binding protein